jgi:hypothetical protein
MTEEASGLRGGVVRRVNAFLQVAARFGDDLAHLAGHRPGDLFLSRNEQVTHALEHIATRGGGGAGPASEAIGGRADRGFDVARIRIGKFPIRSRVSAGFLFSKVLPDTAATHLPAMKFLKVLAMMGGI